MTARLPIRRRNAWALVAVLAGAVAVYYPYSPGGVQAANMRRAEAHAATLRPTLAADPRFARVHLAAYTARDGSLQVAGEVANAADEAALAAIVAASGPPVVVVYAVTADGTVTTAPASP